MSGSTKTEWCEGVCDDEPPSEPAAIAPERAARGSLSLALRSAGPAWAQDRSTAAADFSIKIAPISLEIAPGKIIKTTAYNGTVPGPALRVKEGQPVRIEVTNDSGYPNLIHSHGLMIPSLQDGATEEGSPIIEPEKSLTYSYVAKPAGTRWYHSHAMAMTDLNKSTYTGEFGFFIVEPAAGDPGSYDREVLLAAHHWDGHWVSMQDIKKGRRRTTASRSRITRPPWVIAYSAMVSRSACAKASVCSFGSSTPAATWGSRSPCRGTASRYWLLMATPSRRPQPSMSSSWTSPSVPT